MKRIFLEELGADESSLMNCVCKVYLCLRWHIICYGIVELILDLILMFLHVVSFVTSCEQEDFGGRHLDPGLTYASASELLARMGLGKRSSQDEPPLFGAATDGDANHNMIVGKGSIILLTYFGNKTSNQNL